MAIINMGWHSSVFEGNVDFLEGAYSPIHRNDIGGDYPPSYFLYETDHGCCIKEREHNGYHDSDFEMLIWNHETKSASWYTFATTRGWCYPCYGSRPDATDEVLKEYSIYEAQQEEKWQRYCKIKKVNQQRKLNAQFRTVVRDFNVSREQVERLYKAYHPDMFPLFFKLLNSNLRSDFRKSLRKQLIEWLKGNGKYDKPFSPKQIQYV